MSKRGKRGGGGGGGGGGPGRDDDTTVDRIMAALGHHFALGSDLDLAIELDPRTVDAGFLAAMRRVGVI